MDVRGLASEALGGDPDYVRLPRLRRFLARPLRVAGVALSAVVVAAAAYILNYQPIVPGNGHMGSPCFDQHAVDLLGQGTRALDSRCKDGEKVRWGWTLQNSGPISIELTGVEPQPLRWINPIEVRVVNSMGTHDYVAESRPFHPFPIPHRFGDQFLFFRGVVRGCSSAPGFGNQDEFDRITIRFTVLGIHRSDTLWAAARPSFRCPLT